MGALVELNASLGSSTDWKEGWSGYVKDELSEVREERIDSRRFDACWRRRWARKVRWMALAASSLCAISASVYEGATGAGAGAGAGGVGSRLGVGTRFLGGVVGSDLRGGCGVCDEFILDQ